jgi:hypothetical protein
MKRPATQERQFFTGQIRSHLGRGVSASADQEVAQRGPFL